MKQLKLIGALSIAILLSACGQSGLEGTYTGKLSGMIDAKLTFQPNGKVIGEIMGNEIERNYELDGNKVKIKIDEEQSEIWTLEEDGSLTRMGFKLIKEEDRVKHKLAKLEGAYIATDEDVEVTFKSNGKLTDIYYDTWVDEVVETEGTYELDGSKIKIKFLADWTLEKDGSLTDEEGSKWVKAEWVKRKVSKKSSPDLLEKVVNKSSPDIDGIYSLTYKSEKLPPERSLLLKLESGKVYMRMNGGATQTEEVVEYKVVGNKITDASGRTEIFTLENDGSITIPNIPKEFKFKIGTELE